ncbi:hypothetical protein P4576_15040 [Peribacillus frigoritolerans]|uniref:hypothetical protein n=1 Tax=Peribacillus frigoritolerans TaxID=450367 RepID=UPI002E1CE854|nr:hypothetical protein [Peribacillus frigoritolerans]
MSNLNHENAYRWVKNERIYTLENSEGKVLYAAEDRTCNGNFNTDSMLEDLASECFEELERK